MELRSLIQYKKKGTSSDWASCLVPSSGNWGICLLQILPHMSPSRGMSLLARRYQLVPHLQRSARQGRCCLTILVSRHPRKERISDSPFSFSVVEGMWNSPSQGVNLAWLCIVLIALLQLWVLPTLCTLLVIFYCIIHTMTGQSCNQDGGVIVLSTFLRPSP